MLTLKDLENKIAEFRKNGASDDTELAVANQFAYQPVMDVKYFTAQQMSGECIIIDIDLSYYGCDGTTDLDKRWHKD